jgi:hypothetical protein
MSAPPPTYFNAVLPTMLKWVKLAAVLADTTPVAGYPD